MPRAAVAGRAGAERGSPTTAIASAVAAFVVASAWQKLLESNAAAWVFVGLLLVVALYSAGQPADSTTPTSQLALAHRRSTSNTTEVNQAPQSQQRRRVIASVPSYLATSSSGSLALTACSSGGASTSTHSSALVAVDESSKALVECTVLLCPAPHGCGFRHTCPNLGRNFISCGKHGRHVAPPDGSVWREQVEESEGGAGRLCLCLSWRGSVVDVSDIGACRGWDAEMTEKVLATMSTNGRLGACSLSHPLLDKLAEVLSMDPQAIGEAKRWWKMWQKKQGRTAPAAPSTPPLAIELPSSAVGGRSLPLQRGGLRALRPPRPNALQAGVRRRLMMRAEEQREGGGSAPPSAADDDDAIPAEQLLRRRKGKGGAGFKPPAGGKEGPTVISPVRDQVYGGGPLTDEQKAENSVVGLLATLFFVILAEGIYVAGSGFMPEAFDQFAQDVVLPAFTPTLGLFLAVSTAYGIWKTREGPDGQK